MTDNASNNNTCVNIVVGYFILHFTAKQRLGHCLRCLGHVLNLATKSFLHGKDIDAVELEEGIAPVVNSDLYKELEIWRKRGPVGRLHNMFKYIMGSPQRWQ